MKNILLFACLLSLIGCKPETTSLYGYVEGDYLYIAPTTGGVLDTLWVERGEHVKKGQALFALEDMELKANVAAAKAQVAQAQANLNNLLKGKRPEEIDVILKQRDEARATLKNAKDEYERGKVLIKTNTISTSERDRLETVYLTAKAHLDTLNAELKVANLAARQDEIDAAVAARDVANQRLIEVQQQLEDSAPTAPDDSYVENTFYRKGEFVAAGKAVVVLLPPQNVKIRFFIPQERLPDVRHGLPITVSCDGCKTTIPAKISFISSQAEYTPPIIFSNESREKLVYMIEARPDTPDMQLHPGQPVDIRLGDM